MPEMIGSNLLAALVLPTLERNGQRDDVDRRKAVVRPVCEAALEDCFLYGHPAAIGDGHDEARASFCR